MMTKKHILLMLAMYFIFDNANAQFFAEINTGYAAPVYFIGYSKINETNFPNTYNYYDNSKDIDTSITTYNKFNMGYGEFIGSKFGYNLNNNFTLAIGFVFLDNYKYSLFYEPFIMTNRNMSNIYIDDANFSLLDFHKQTFYYGKRLSISPSVSYKLYKNRFGFASSLGLSFSYIRLYRDIVTANDAIRSYSGIEIFDNKKNIEKQYFTKNNQFGLNYSLALLYKASNNLELNLAAELNTLLSFFVNDGVQYYSSEYLQIDNNVIEDSENIEELIIPSTRPEYYNFNTINISIGIRYYFNGTK